MKTKYREITANLTGGKIRYEQMEGKKYLVAPMVMLTEGVHNGSGGPLYYPKEELSKTPEVWNYKPIVLYHPEMNGRPVSACDPVILTNRKVGVIMNAEFDGRLKAEAWLEEEKLKEVDERIYNAIENDEPVELSTGVYTDNEPQGGTWNGEEYEAIARNYRPDHLALLPDKVGACSVQDGAGLMVNLRMNTEMGDFQQMIDALSGVQLKSYRCLNCEAINTVGENGELETCAECGGDELEEPLDLTDNSMSYADLWDKLQGKLPHDAEGEPMAHIVALYPTYIVYEQNETLYKQSYKKNRDEPTLEGTPEEVERVVKYTTVNNTSNLEAEQMEKNELIGKLIDSEATQFAEEDQEQLEEMDVEVLEKMVPVENDEPEEEPEEEVENDVEEEPEDNASSVDDFIESAPEEYQDMLRNGLQQHRDRREQLIDVILDNENNSFEREELEAQSTGFLENTAKLASPTDNEDGEDAESLTRFDGQGEVVDNDADNEEPLEAPTMNWDSE